MNRTGTLILFATLITVGCRGSRPLDLGYGNGHLVDCPDRPNCVSSQAAPESSHYIAPIAVQKTPEASLVEIEKIIQNTPRTRIVERESRYLRAEYESLVFRFVDDVEFLVGEDSSLVQIRSASRLGHSDLGANRKRIEDIREAYLIRLKSQSALE